MPKLDYLGRDMSKYNQNVPIKATIQFPQLSTRTVWVGAYWEMHNEVVIFHTKPKKCGDQVNDLSKESEPLVTPYDCYENRDKIAGSCDGGQFESMFGFSVESKALEPIELFKMEMTAPFDESGVIVGMSFHLNWG